MENCFLVRDVADSWLSPSRTPTNKLELEEDISVNESSVFMSQNFDDIDFVVKPPEGWGDSPESPTNTSFLLDKTLEDVGGGDEREVEIPVEYGRGAQDDQVKQQQQLQVTNQQTKKKRKLRCKSEERPFKESTRSDAATQSSISLHASLHDLSTIDDDDSGKETKTN